jgi:hypothetical protein
MEVLRIRAIELQRRLDKEVQEFIKEFKKSSQRKQTEKEKKR